MYFGFDPLVLLHTPPPFLLSLPTGGRRGTCKVSAVNDNTSAPVTVLSLRNVITASASLVYDYRKHVCTAWR